MNSPATPARNEALDRLIAELADLLAPTEDRLVAEYATPRRPVTLVVGAPRSGTTLTTQWLAASGAFAYPTNLLARFSRTPAIAARIQLLLTDPRYGMRDELFDLAAVGSESFRSDLGKTAGALAPNEFAFFWRRFLRTQEIRPLGADGIAAADLVGLRSSLAAIEHAFGKPLAMKSMFVQYDLPAFADALPTALFVHVIRDPVRNAISLLESRERYHGSRAVWYSARPAETPALLALDPIRQVAGQVVHTVRAIRRGAAALPASRTIEVRYEEFCRSPAKTWDALRERLVAAGEDPGRYVGPESFEPTRATTDHALEAELRRALAELGEEP